MTETAFERLDHHARLTRPRGLNLDDAWLQKFADLHVHYTFRATRG
jgi:hypothetical protein